jgi:branched-chain amino acid transport system ATP-binding protein
MVNLNKEKTTILLAEQNAHLGLDVASRVYLLEVGKVILKGTDSQLRSEEVVVRAYPEG